MSKGQFKLNSSADAMNRLFRLFYWGPPLLFLGIYLAVHNRASFWEPLMNIRLQWIGLLLLVAVLHECMHAIGYWLAGASLRSVSFRIDKEYLSIACNCTDAISIGGLRLSVILPFLLLTPLLVLLALITGDVGAWLLLTFSISSCAFDLSVSAALMGAPNELRIIPELHGENGSIFLNAASVQNK